MKTVTWLVAVAMLALFGFFPYAAEAAGGGRHKGKAGVEKVEKKGGKHRGKKGKKHGKKGGKKNGKHGKKHGRQGSHGKRGGGR
jgi:hypothetical protein